MFHQTSLDSFLAAPVAMHVPVVREGPADMLTPVGAARRLFVPGSPSFLLESAEGGERMGRYSLLGTQAVDEIGREGASLDDLRAFVARHQVAPVTLPGALPAGAVGYLGYDGVRLWERIPDRHAASRVLPDLLFVHFRDLVVFDHLRQRLYLVTLAPAGEPRTAVSFAAAQERLDVLAWRLSAPIAALGPSHAPVQTGAVQVTPDDDTFRAQVAQAREYILAGDVFQVVLARKFQADFHGDPLAFYRALRMVNPSPFLFFLDFGDHQVIGASPEDLVRVQGDHVETLPIAGTRRRGENDDEDRALAEELLADPKERAEHLMLVDLARNDIGRIAVPGTVRVLEQMSVQRFSHVIHLVSRVAGTRRPGTDALDALCACFPAGTVSGAPKIRAMEIIDELEPTRRGIYAGSVCYFDGRGNLDSCIAIRTAVLHNGQLTVQAGAGIVADSDPHAEEEETRNKARAALTAMALAGRLS